MAKRPTDVATILTTLLRHRVRFVLVRGVAAVIEGVPIATFDLDIVPDRTVRNVDRLMAALAELKASYRHRPSVRPTVDALRGPGHHLLLTRYGPLDVLGRIGKGRDFGALLPHSRRRVIAGAHLRVRDLETQIAVKEEFDFPKDRAVVPVLRAALAERRLR